MARDRLPVPWDEAREVLVIVVAVAAVSWILQPVVEVLTDGRDYGFGDDLQAALRHVDPVGGGLLLGAAAVLASTPAVDVVPRLRRGLGLTAGLVAVAGMVAVVNDLGVGRVGGVDAWTRIEAVMARSGPGTLLTATAGWLAARVRAFPPG